MSTVRRFAVLLAIYLFALIPIYSILAVLEGGVRGRWHLSAQDWIYQGSAALGQAGTLFIAGGVVAVPIIAIATRLLADARRGPAVSAFVAFVAVSVCVGLLARGLLLIFPFSFIASTSAYSLMVRAIVKSEQSIAHAT